MPKIFLRHCHEFITHAKVEGESGSHLPVVLEISAELFLTPVKDLHGLVNLSSGKLEAGGQICFHLIYITSQKGVERVEGIKSVVAAVNLIHDEAHRVVFRSDLERVIGSRDGEVISI